MKSRSWCSRARQSKRFLGITLLTLAVCVGAGTVARASDAPDWMRSQVNAPVPAHDEKTNAVEMYSETLVTVLSEDEVRVRERRVYKILRPEGREYGIVGQAFTPSTKITAMKAWCIPASGKDYEVKEKESVDVAYNKVDGGELISDVKIRLMQIPAADVGNLVGYELELRENPLVLQQWWGIQGAAGGALCAASAGGLAVQGDVHEHSRGAARAATARYMGVGGARRSRSARRGRDAALRGRGRAHDRDDDSSRRTFAAHH